MSLVYNNDKPIGKCESYSIDKIPGTTPFVMLTNYEPLRSELNENQQVVLDELCDTFESEMPMTTIYGLVKYPVGESGNAYSELSPLEEIQVLQAFAEWGMKEVAE